MTRPELMLTDNCLDDLRALVDAVRTENSAQRDKWGIQRHSIAWWLCILGEEVGELNEAALEEHFGDGTLQHMHDEAIQVATVALKIAEMTRHAEIRRA